MTGLLLFFLYSFNPFHSPSFSKNDCGVTEYESNYDLQGSIKIYIKILNVGKNSYSYVYYWPERPELGTSNSVHYDSIAFKDSGFSKVDCPQ